MFLMLLLSAGLIGLSLGLLGAGGSILTVPALTLFLGLDEKSAITSSMLIVGLISAVGGIKAYRNRQLDLSILVSFGIVSLPFAALGARIGIWLPQGSQTLLLVAIMCIAAYKMFASTVRSDSDTSSSSYTNSMATSVSAPPPGKRALLTAAASVGLITGVVGVGGGFLIVPALIFFTGIGMQKAVANSLVLIVINAFTAFTTIAVGGHGVELDAIIIITMASIGAICVLAGQSISSRLDQRTLKRGFSTLIVLVAIWLLINLLY
ncbi:hypothetical protein GMES_0162 [Paraglaciecola mesophila KMM 241]|uniref:Probable membrane transporter protein n=2 Tax=Paraglaciecola mesophila TaxID=197222 RepID=K6YWC8_9ALTE|nr:hypothetical protein GMES_0162 [Paraglaciecola mesophila KMM 241]|tara:strand:+ start:513 stop:1307 length:795 start_codon:yes stop_codon:yes gene_type:complete